jgi:hypothetical protein
MSVQGFLLSLRRSYLGRLLQKLLFKSLAPVGYLGKGKGGRLLIAPARLKGLLLLLFLGHLLMELLGISFLLIKLKFQVLFLVKVQKSRLLVPVIHWLLGSLR